MTEIKDRKKERKTRKLTYEERTDKWEFFIWSGNQTWLGESCCNMKLLQSASKLKYWNSLFIQADRQTDRQKDRETESQRNRKTNMRIQSQR